MESKLQELTDTLSELIQSEKMSAVGQLGVGIAHEINGPAGFIHGNLPHVEGYIKDILELLELYQRNFPEATPEIQERIEDIDLEFIQEDLPKLLSSMRAGTTHIQEIVRSWRTFSQWGEAVRTSVDLHSGLDSTLVILANRFESTPQRPEIILTKEYGNLPRVDCFAGQINQVFMNILANEIDAVEESNKGKTYAEIEKTPNVIRIKTEFNSDRNTAVIKITDNGVGIPEEIIQRIFDPFFTTKPIGRGTGLGLSISYQIVVEKHGGKLSCNSTPGEGSEFVIEIPIQPIKP